MGQTIQIVVDAELLKEANRVAKRRKVNRSALMREALQEYLKRVRIKEMEDRERRAYETIPDDASAWDVWEREAVWPEE